MRALIALLPDQRGAAAVEMAMVIPILLVLTFGPIELGNYFMSEHALIKGVRDGATFAAHQDASNYDCTAPGSVSNTLKASVEDVVRGGQLTTGNDRLPNWDSAQTTFTVTFSCVTQAADGTGLSGMYKLNGGNVPVVTVTASLPYRWAVGNVVFPASGLKVNASEQATVLGI
ncbi:TadE/TadG family type IV pilus assembly protein [Sphingomonas sp.]|uniref:TadE/TadG family type IV pilus assembly protein n=1 Tax=Sphingomonas sp. TaxID=28214 RepID=UPI0025EEDF69|nr:TadE/TadG family type IV pilus assembly protein [Sphingomonas sp.]MBV9527438.1 pilus assembly protein [Sphingomonas sp.]